MAISSKIIPLFVLFVFVTALVGIFMSRIESKPGLMDEDFLNIALNREVKLKKIVLNKDFTLVVFFRAQNFEDKKPLNELLTFKSIDLGVDYGIVMLGIDGNYNSFRQFLMDNTRYFLAFTWLYTNNTNYFRYVEEPGSLNVYVFWVEDGDVKYEYIGADLGSEEIREAIEALGLTG